MRRFLRSGVGAQHMALRNIGLPYKVVGTSDWDINATLSYNAIHTEKFVDYSKEVSIGEIHDYLEVLCISSDGKTPLTRAKIERLNESKLKEIYNAFRNSNNLGSIVTIDPDTVPDHDLFTYSFPCQAISIAGKQNGLEKDSGTSSSLLWECQKIIESKKPKYLLMENVKNLVGKKFKPFFDEWVEYLDRQGYKTYWKVMNAKNYGTPQNRERVFALSVLKTIPGEYTFPSEKMLTKRLKDVLELEVDEKFYISQEKVDQLIANLDGKIDISKQVIGTCHPKNDLSFATRDRVYNEDKNAPALTATMYKDAPKVLISQSYEDPKLIRVGNVNPSGRGMNGEVVHEDGLAPTITTNKGEGSKVLQIGNIVNTGNWDNPQRGRIYSSEGISPSLNTVGGGGLEPKILIKNATKIGYTEATDGDGIDLNYPNSNTRRGRIQKGVSHTLKTDSTVGVVELEKISKTDDLDNVLGGIYTNDSPKFNRGIKDGLSRTIKANSHDAAVAFTNPFRIRKLTPLECWRLMAFSDDDFYKAQAIHSNSTLYKQAGNSIVVTCLEGIFSQLHKIHNQHIEQIEEDIHRNKNEIVKEEKKKMTTDVKRPDKPIVVLDFETTGFSPFNDEVTEVGAIVIDGKTGEVCNVFDSLIKVTKTIPYKVAELTGITNQLTDKHGLPFEVVKSYLQVLCKDAIVVAHNVQFDFQFLKHQFDIEPQFYYDTLTISRALYPEEKTHKLGDICARAGILLNGAHRALNDVEATVQLLNKQLNTSEVAMKYINTISSYRGLKFKPANTREVI